MTYLPQLRAELVHAAERRTAVASRRRFPSNALAVAVSVAVTVIVAAVAVFAVKHGHTASGRKAAAPAARPRTEEPLLEQLAVLRRPQTSADRSFPGLIGSLPRKQAGSDVQPLLSQVRLATVTAWGAKVFLVPARPRSALVARRAPEVITTWVQGIGWDDWSYPSDIGAGNDFGPGAIVHLPRGRTVNRFVEVVPDGVATVAFYRLRFPSRRVGGATVAVVRNNVAVFQIAGTGSDIVLARWFAPDGRLIKRIGTWSLVRSQPALPGLPSAPGARVHAR